MTEQTQPPSPAAPDEARYFNRDLSWLEFNRRVLAQAADDSFPLLERVKFLAIFSNNLDEFFMKRVGLLKRYIASGVETPSPDGRRPTRTLGELRAMTKGLQAEQARIWLEIARPQLVEAGIHILQYGEVVDTEGVAGGTIHRPEAIVGEIRQGIGEGNPGVYFMLPHHTTRAGSVGEVDAVHVADGVVQYTCAINTSVGEKL